LNFDADHTLQINVIDQSEIESNIYDESPLLKSDINHQIKNISESDHFKVSEDDQSFEKSSRRSFSDNKTESVSNTSRSNKMMKIPNLFVQNLDSPQTRLKFMEAESTITPQRNKNNVDEFHLDPKNRKKNKITRSGSELTSNKLIFKSQALQRKSTTKDEKKFTYNRENTLSEFQKDTILK
jgi:hypothetical protein